MPIEQRAYRKRELLTFILSYWRRFGFGPSYQEMANGLGYQTTSAVAYWLDKLEDEGLITRTPGTARTVKVKE